MEKTTKKYYEKQLKKTCFRINFFALVLISDDEYVINSHIICNFSARLRIVIRI